jgi:hypothetical protein
MSVSARFVTEPGLRFFLYQRDGEKLAADGPEALEGALVGALYERRQFGEHVMLAASAVT